MSSSLNCLSDDSKNMHLGMEISMVKYQYFLPKKDCHETMNNMEIC